ncbi:hypothetical protein EPR50_G00117300 [Perca flavescens]|uniref:Uncharacterized protein n=1 Tax=Perca flavescens TaxID=8167 RepID=A0A484CT52_PERFV|nr:hypothetical protein EPR50_G00117300 [Perca flavescens]
MQNKEQTQIHLRTQVYLSGVEVTLHPQKRKQISSFKEETSAREQESKTSYIPVRSGVCVTSQWSVVLSQR